MSEHPDGYKFTKPEGLLAHYTKASTAFEHILPGKLRLSPYRLMRDPAENKDIRPNIFASGIGAEADRAIYEFYAQIKAARDRMRVLSLTRDGDGGGDSSTFDCCWARPRMWEQYGDNHLGVCLLFDRARLERAICEQWPDDQIRQLGNVEYRRDGSAEVWRRTAYVPRGPSDEEDLAGMAADLIRDNPDAYFFLKSDDFATEYEYRVVLTASIRNEEEYAYVDYRDSLVGVVLGERVPPWQRAAAIKACSTLEAKLGKGKLGRIEWIHGRPRVFPVR
jgi:hypothetical protein